MGPSDNPSHERGGDAGDGNGGSLNDVDDPFPAFVRYRCPECQYNDMASLIFTTQEKGRGIIFKVPYFTF